MRTKTLLLTAAVFAAGLAASMAQVYSVNSVGYVNVPVVKQYNLVSNPLNGTNNNVNTVIPVAADGSIVLQWNPASQSFANSTTYFDVGDPAINGWYNGEDRSTMTLPPGQAFFLFNPASGTITNLTFVGEVPQGTNLTVSVAYKYGFYSSIVPQAAPLSALNFPVRDGMTYDIWNATAQGYTGHITYYDVGDPLVNGWYDGADNKYDPAVAVGGGVLIFNPHVGGDSWVRSFNVNN